MSVKEVSANCCFDGWHKQFEHDSERLHCRMRFAIYLPPKVSSTLHDDEKVPVLYWLSGLTCSDENFMQKAGAQRLAAQLGMAIVAPDTSPRGKDVPDDPEGNYDLGLGAGFYLNATQTPWRKHYQMYDYVVHELPALIEAHFPVTAQRALAGHSMGGHGALTIGLKNPDRYTSISAFSPITNPMHCPWGQKAFKAYLGEDTTPWRAYDSCVLMANSKPEQRLPILIDQGDEDPFLAEQLKPEALQQVARDTDYPLTLRRHEHYDHSYYFIASFIDDHMRFHAKYLFAT